VIFIAAFVALPLPLPLERARELELRQTCEQTFSWRASLLRCRRAAAPPAYLVPPRLAARLIDAEKSLTSAVGAGKLNPPGACVIDGRIRSRNTPLSHALMLMSEVLTKESYTSFTQISGRARRKRVCDALSMFSPLQNAQIDRPRGFPATSSFSVSRVWLLGLGGAGGSPHAAAMGCFDVCSMAVRARGDRAKRA